MGNEPQGGDLRGKNLKRGKNGTPIPKLPERFPPLKKFPTR